MGGKRVAVLISGVEREYQQAVMRGVEMEAREKGMACYAFCCQGRMENAVPTSAEAEADIFRLPDLGRFDGVIAFRATLSNPLALLALNEALRGAEGRPLVMVDERIAGRVCIGFDDARPVRAVTEHFIDAHGARRLCFVGGPRDNPVSLARQRAFEDVLRERGLPFDEEQLFGGEFLREGGERAARYFFRDGARRPDAIVCANDDMALGLCETLTALGVRVPQKVGVSGFDCLAESKASLPTLTTVRRPVFEAGREAVRLLCRQMDGDTPPEWTALQDDLIIGQSCGCSRADDAQRERSIRALCRQKNELFEEYGQANAFARRMSGTRNDRDFRARMTDYAREQSMQELFVAVMDGPEPRGENLAEPPEDCRRYAPAMRLAFGRLGGVTLPEYRFDTAELFPPGCAPQAAVFFPLHADGRNLGYVAMALERATHFSVYTLVPSLGGTLENMRLHATIREYAEALERMYVHDSLTGLLNRRGYAKYAEEMYERARREGVGLMIVCADMDALKHINDTYGHGEGDAAIKALAACMQQVAAASDLCIHLSGDEFMLVGVGYDEEGMRRYIRLIQTEIDRSNTLGTKPYKISASFGGHVGRPDGSVTLETMCNLADDEMYRAKKRRHAAGRE